MENPEIEKDPKGGIFAEDMQDDSYGPNEIHEDPLRKKSPKPETKTEKKPPKTKLL